MSLIVQKFGGSSVRDTERLLRMAHIVRERRAEGNDVVVVLSAQGDTTDTLLKKALELTTSPDGRELDALLASGEQVSAALGALALQTLGVDAVSLSAWQVPIETDGAHGDAQIELIDTARIRRELDAGRVAVVTGFQGIDERGDITTLGRGGSDTSAVALAAALRADELIIYTDVDGIFSSDPRVCPDAVRRERISYDDMLLLANSDADTLTIKPEACQPDLLLLDTYEKFEPLAKKNGLHLILTLPEEILPDCFCDIHRTEQIFSIIVDNALCYTPSGGKVTLSCHAENEMLCFLFEDTGCGISEEKKSHIFERFYRADDAHTDREHFGLGLCIAKELTEKQNGNIQVVDAPISGSCFMVQLPCAL